MSIYWRSTKVFAIQESVLRLLFFDNTRELILWKKLQRFLFQIWTKTCHSSCYVKYIFLVVPLSAHLVSRLETCSQDRFKRQGTNWRGNRRGQFMQTFSYFTSTLSPSPIHALGRLRLTSDLIPCGRRLWVEYQYTLSKVETRWDHDLKTSNTTY